MDTDDTFTKEDIGNLIFGEWEKQLDRLPENEAQFKEFTAIFLQATGCEEKSPLAFLFKGFLLGLDAGWELADFLSKK